MKKNLETAVFFHSVAQNDVDTVKSMLAKNVFLINQVYSFWDKTPLHVAARWRRFEMVQTLLDYTTDIDKPDAYGKSALWEAVSCNQYEIAKLLINHGASLENMLFFALSLQRKRLVKLLLRNGAMENGSTTQELPHWFFRHVIFHFHSGWTFLSDHPKILKRQKVVVMFWCCKKKNLNKKVYFSG